MTDGVLLLSIIYAAIGLVLSLIMHLLSFAGFQSADIGGFFWALHAGLFPLWLPVGLAATKMTRRASDKDFWEATLSGCPAWMRYITYGIFAYALVIMFLISIYMVIVGADAPGSGLLGLRVFSAVWMFFYGVGLATLTSAFRQGLYP
jgi:hypothetical protein